MTKKKKTFRKFINEQVLGVKQKEKQFDKFEDFVKDVKGIKPPENKAETFQEFINEAKGYEFDNDSVDKFDNMVLESKIEQEKQKLEERKTRIDPSPIVLTNRQIEEMNRRRIIEEINEVLKYRGPVLNKMSFQEWLKIPQNFFVFELSNEQAKRLYEQDMSRVEKYEELKKKSGKGRNRVAVASTEEDPFTPEDLVKSASDGWFNPSGMAKNSSSTGYEPADGDAVVEWRVNGTTSGLSKMFNTTAAAQPSYIAEHTNWDSSINHPGIGRPVGGGSSTYGYQAFLSNTNDGTWDRADGDNYTIAIAHTTLNVTDFKGNTGSGRCFVRWTNGTGGGSAGYTDYIWDSKNNASDITTRARGNSSSHDQHYTRTDGASTRLIALRRDGSTASVFYNSGTAVQTYTPSGTATDTAHFGFVRLDAAVIAEVLFLKYAASDSEMDRLMAYWADKYGA